MYGSAKRTTPKVKPVNLLATMEARLDILERQLEYMQADMNKYDKLLNELKGRYDAEHASDGK